MAYLGNNLQAAFSSYRNIDDISGSFNGATTSFPLLVNGSAPSPLPINSNQCLISVNGVVQRPDDSGTEGFRLSGGNIVFSAAPGTGQDFFGVILAGADYINVGANFPDGTAAAPSITFDQDLDTGIYRSSSGVTSITSNGTQAASFSQSGTIINADNIQINTAKTPASASASGTAGQIVWDSNYVYVCVANNTWKRSALSTW